MARMHIYGFVLFLFTPDWEDFFFNGETNIPFGAFSHSKVGMVLFYLLAHDQVD